MRSVSARSASHDLRLHAERAVFVYAGPGPHAPRPCFCSRGCPSTRGTLEGPSGIATAVLASYQIGRRVPEKGGLRVLAGDRVRCELSPYDLSKGRITYRYK